MILKELDTELWYREDLRAAIIENIKKKHTLFPMTDDKAMQYDLKHNFNNAAFKFRNEGRCVLALIENLMRENKTKIYTKETWKINAMCTSEPFDDKPICIGGVYDVPILFDIEKYWKENEQNKKRMIFKGITEAFKQVEQLEPEWNLTPFWEACKIAEENDFYSEYIWNRKKNPKSKDTVEIYCNHKLESMDIYMIFRDNKEEIIDKYLLISTLPHEFEFVQYLGDLKWISDKKAALYDINGKKRFVRKKK